MAQFNFFPYSWHIRDSEIHVYGFQQDDNSQVSLLRIQEFMPFVYIKLPTHLDDAKNRKTKIAWNNSEIVHRLVQCLQNPTPKKENNRYKTRIKIAKHEIVYKQPLYYADVFVDPKDKKLKQRLVPYLFLAFDSDKERKTFRYSFNSNVSVMNVGNLTLELYEENASSVLQLTCVRNISTADWCRVKNAQLATEPISRLDGREYTVNWKGLSPLKEEKSQLFGIPQPYIMSYDIECNSHDPNKFSDGSHPNDIVFQISCVFGRQGTPKESWEKYLLTLGVPDESYLKTSGIQVRSYKKEFALLQAFNDLVVEKNPQILLGYNIFKFDIPYMYKRACDQRIQDDFVKHGCTIEKCKMEKIKWSSSAYSNQEMNFINLQGRVTIDLLTLVQRDYNLENYKLDTVAEKFIGAKKDPLNHLDIFMCYEIGMKETKSLGKSKSLALVGKYCVKDSVLVLELFERLQYWYSLTEMAKICQVPHAHLFLYGQQLKVFSQVYKYCFNHNIVTESGRFKPSPDDFCAGAYVLTPTPGLYDNVVSFDFASLYPSIIISHNFDFTTLVAEDSEVSEEHTRQISWSEHVNCGCPNATITDEKESRCKIYSFRWLKSIPGVLPTIIKDLLSARKQVRQQMKSVEKNSMLYDILNKRQLAYKVSSNSMYGILSTKTGYLPFLPAGMCVTAVGRQSIERVSHIIRKEHKGEIVYGDTDSNYVIFPHLKDLKEVWAHCVHVSEEVSKYFPEPMRLEFEENIYARYLILSKKRYLYFTCDTDGRRGTKIENKGVLLKRRDNSKVVRDIYEDIMRMILNGESEIDVISKFLYYVALIYGGVPETEDYRMSKSVKSVDAFPISDRNNKSIQYGDYVVPKLKTDPKERLAQFAEKNVTTEEDFYRASLPGAVQLALRMRTRGQHIESGSRLSFVVTRRGGRNVSDKMEEVEYFKLYYSKRMIDVAYYLHILINPIEEVFKVIYGKKKYENFVKDIYDFRIKYDQVMAQLFRVFNKIVFL